MATAALKPCPFCGDARVELAADDGLSTRVRCLSCAAEGGWGHTRDRAARFWNMRASSAGSAALSLALDVTSRFGIGRAYQWIGNRLFGGERS